MAGIAGIVIAILLNNDSVEVFWPISLLDE